MKHQSFFALLLAIVACASGCKQQANPTAPTISGIYSFHSSDSSIRHGTDILVINSDSTYVHFYANGSSRKQLVQDGTWKQGEGDSIVFGKFVGWDLFGPTPDGVTYPDPRKYRVSAWPWTKRRLRNRCKSRSRREVCTNRTEQSLIRHLSGEYGGNTTGGEYGDMIPIHPISGGWPRSR